MKINLGNVRKPRIEMLPLIDIVFLLLVFFIYAMLSMAVHRALPVALPKSSTAKIDKQAVLSITVKSDGTIYLNKTSVSLENLAHVLAERVKKEKDPRVLLFGDRNLPYQDLFQVLDQIKVAGISNISLEAEGPGER
ncbi:MAG: biopolymer transporter ExbD [Deltaproteobacteria bacterium]|nr:biopolymer transporter ExbD [Deltaproteobacteria bacterium]